MKLQGKSQGNLKISYLNSMKMQGRSGKTQKILMKATKVHKKSCERN